MIYVKGLIVFVALIVMSLLLFQILYKIEKKYYKE